MLDILIFIFMICTLGSVLLMFITEDIFFGVTFILFAVMLLGLIATKGTTPRDLTDAEHVARSSDFVVIDEDTVFQLSERICYDVEHIADNTFKMEQVECEPE